MFDEFDFGTGEIIYLSEYHCEDMLLVCFPNEHFLDIGWYGDENGFFIYLSRDNDWRTPIAKYIAKTRDELNLLIPKAIERIIRESSSNKPYYGPLWKTDIYTV